MELTMEQIKGEFVGLQKSIETQVKDLLVCSSEESKKATDGLQKQLSELKGYVDKLEADSKQMKAASMPGFGDKEAKKFSFTSFIGALYKQAFSGAAGHDNPWHGAGYEQEVVREYAKVRANEAGDGSAGGVLIPQELTNDIVEMAIAQTPILNLGVTMIRGLVGDLPVPTITGRPTSYWVGENGKPTASQATYGQKNLRPKKVGCFTKQSNRLIYQSRGVSDQIIKQLLAESMALKFHEGLVNGTGSNYQPLGIMHQTGFTTSTVPTSGDLRGTRFKIDHAANMQMDLDVADELNMPGTFGYLMRPEVLAGMKRQTVVQYSGQAAADGAPVMALNPLMSNQVIRDVLGYNFGTSTQLSGTETSYGSSTTSSVLFGNWAKFWVAFWRDFAIKVSDVAGDGSTGSAFLDDQMYIVAFQEVDCLAMRPAAFTKVIGAQVSPASW